MISGSVIKKRLLFSNLKNRLEKMGCFIYYSYLNENKKKVYSRHSHDLYIDYKFLKTIFKLFLVFSNQACYNEYCSSDLQS